MVQNKKKDNYKFNTKILQRRPAKKILDISFGTGALLREPRQFKGCYGVDKSPRQLIFIKKDYCIM